MKKLVYCEECKWKEWTWCKGDPSAFCNNPKTLEQSSQLKEGERQFCNSINRNNGCKHFEKKKHWWQ